MRFKIRFGLVVGLAIHGGFVLWWLVQGWVPRNLAGRIFNTGVYVFPLHFYILYGAGGLEHFPQPLLVSFWRNFLGLLLSFPISVAYAYALRMIYRTSVSWFRKH
jgi:hypothetical protein